MGICSSPSVFIPLSVFTRTGPTAVQLSLVEDVTGREKAEGRASVDHQMYFA